MHELDHGRVLARSLGQVHVGVRIIHRVVLVRGLRENVTQQRLIAVARAEGILDRRKNVGPR